MQPKTIVEIGSFIGISTLWMASGFDQSNKDGMLHAIDLFYEIMPCYPYRCGYVKDPLSFIQSAALSAHLADRIRCHQMNSYHAGQQRETFLQTPIDLLYIDGDHSIRGCMNDFALFVPYVSCGGIIILHDIYPDVCGYHGPRYLIDHVIKPSSAFQVIEMTTTPRNYGMAIIQKTRHHITLWDSIGSWQLAYIRFKARLQQRQYWNSLRTTLLFRSIKQFFK